MGVQADITKKAEEILASLRRPIEIGGNEFEVYCSIGIATSSNGEIHPDQLLQHADIAMFEAKKEGKNTYCYFRPEMEEKISHRFHMERELRLALEQEQFFM